MLVTPAVLWKPKWTDLSEPEPREERPKAMRKQAWTAAHRAVVANVELLVADQFRNDDSEGIAPRLYALATPGETSSWLALRSEFEHVYLEVSLSLGGDRRLGRESLTALEDLGFELHTELLVAFHWVDLDTRRPEPGWALAAQLAATTLATVFGPHLPTVDQPSGWTLVNLEADEDAGPPTLEQVRAAAQRHFEETGREQLVVVSVNDGWGGLEWHAALRAAHSTKRFAKVWAMTESPTRSKALKRAKAWAAGRDDGSLWDVVEL